MNTRSKFKNCWSSSALQQSKFTHFPTALVDAGRAGKRSPWAPAPGLPLPLQAPRPLCLPLHGAAASFPHLVSGPDAGHLLRPRLRRVLCQWLHLPHRHIPRKRTCGGGEVPRPKEGAPSHRFKPASCKRLPQMVPTPHCSRHPPCLPL